MTTIHVITCVTTNHIDYCNLLFKTMKDNESGTNTVEYFYVYSGEMGKLPENGKMIGNWKPSETTPRHGSMYHGLTLNYFVEHHQHTSDITIIVDADVAITYKNWDEVVTSELSKVDVFGAEYLQRKRYRKFPCIFFFATHTKNITKDIDFTPTLKDNKRRVSHQRGGKNLYKSKKIGTDTGWKLVEYFKTRLASSDVLKCKYSDVLIDKKKHDKKSEMWFYEDELFGSHFSASSYYSTYTTEFTNWYKMLFN